jgi:hypothetical protein
LRAPGLGAREYVVPLDKLCHGSDIADRGREMGADAGARYRAFISYSHVDQAFGRKLHRRLERYALPGRLVGRATSRGPVPRRVAPVFRDREEFSAAGDLTAEVRAALAASGALIVVCSPAAAGSPWVGREIELFRELHPDRPILAAVAVGAPAECFPAALTRDREPLAADFRAEADGPRLGLLKLVAGVVGVGLDELIQRDAQRRMVAVTAVTSGAVAVALAMSALTTFALLAQREAERQRGQAEALVEFMLTDLRDRLKGVGRLDVLTSVNERTLRYYADQKIEDLPPASQARYARILLAMGEDDMTRGQAAPALAKFQAAEKVTSRLLAEEPVDPERIWAQGQSEYWLGYHAYASRDRARASASWAEYRARALQLVASHPQSSKYRRELAYADGNLCTLALVTPPDALRAKEYCGRALAEMKDAARVDGANPAIVDDLINRHAWMADAYQADRDFRRARKERLAEEALLAKRIADDPKNARLKKAWVVLQWALAGFDAREKRYEAARTRLEAARSQLKQMQAFEPRNEESERLRKKVGDALEYLDGLSRREQATKGAR